MNHLSSYCTIDYSSLYSVRVLRVVLYSVEIILYKLSLINHVYLSEQNCPKQKELIKMINRSEKTVVCKSFKFGLILAELTRPIVLDLSNLNMQRLTIKQVENLKWSLIQVSAVTPRTKELTKKLIPSDFPVVDLAQYK